MHSSSRPRQGHGTPLIAYLSAVKSAVYDRRPAACQNQKVRVLLVSTYDLGRQPFGLASPAAWLKEAGIEVACADVSKERLSEDAVSAADMIAFFLPMHTATRLALPVIDRVRALNPAARLVAYGLYAPLNRTLLEEHGITTVLGGEFEEALVDVARRTSGPRDEGGRLARPRRRQARRLLAVSIFVCPIDLASCR